MTGKEVEELTAVYGKSIYSFCCYLTGSTQTADDLYQDILLKALEIREKIETDEHGDLKAKYARPKNYLIGVGVRLWKKKRAKLHRFSYELSLDDEENQVSEMAADGVGVEELIEEKAVIQAVREAAAKLPEKFRTVIFMHYTGGMSVEDMARALQLPKGTVKSRLFHARKRMKEEMEAMGYESRTG